MGEEGAKEHLRSSQEEENHLGKDDLNEGISGMMGDVARASQAVVGRNAWTSKEGTGVVGTRDHALGECSTATDRRKCAASGYQRGENAEH